MANVLKVQEQDSIARLVAKRAVTIQTVGKWRERFVQGRLESLGDAPRSGQPRKLTDDTAKVASEAGVAP